MSAAPPLAFAAFALLACLLALAGSRWRGLAGVSDTAPFRLVLSFFAGVLALHLLLIVFDLVHVSWGMKGERFFLARATDYAYLARPWNWVIRPAYPNLGSKTEGVALAAILILVQGARAAAWRRDSWRRLDVGAAAALLLPAALVVLPWQVYLHRYQLLSQVQIGGVNPRHAHGIAQALHYELTANPTWHGFSYCLFLLPLLALRPRLRPIATVVSLQLLFYLYVYFSFRYDPVPLVITSFERLQLHLLPVILVAAGIALEPSPPDSRGSESESGETSGE